MRTKFSGFLTLLLVLIVQLGFAQEKTITGTVVDPDGLPLPGTTVQVKGKSTGTQTDFDGNYSITAAEGDVLVFSYIGFKTFEAPVGSSSTVDVTMQMDAEQLGEVVVTGALGIKRKKEELTAAQEVVKAEKLTQAAQPDAVVALTGKVSGLNITTTNTGVSETTRVVLRGGRSISGNNQALVVVDGVISSLNFLRSIDPNNIASVNVIKGANGAALYGSQGSNGVIVVETKKGADGEGKMTVSIRSNIDFQSVAYLPERQTRYGQGWSSGNGWANYTYENGGWGPEFDGQMATIGLPQADGSYVTRPYSTLGADNIKEFFQTGVTTQNQASLAYGDSEGYANLSVQNQQREFVIQDDVLKQNSFNFKAGKTLGKWHLSGNATYSTRHTEEADSGLYADLLQTASNIPVQAFENSGNEGHWNGYYLNPYWLRDNNRYDTTTERANFIGEIGYDFTDHINVILRSNAYLTTSNTLFHQAGYTDPASVAAITGNTRTQTSGFYRQSLFDRNYYTDLIVNFDYDLSDDFTLKANVGANNQYYTQEITKVGGTNLTTEGLYTTGNLENGVTIAAPGSGGMNTWDRQRIERKYAVYAQIDLGYKDFLFLNATGRNDWTSLLADGNNSFFYPSVGLSFVPTKAIEGLKNSETVNFLKVFASYVQVGNDGSINPYSINPTLTQGTGYPMDQNSYLISTSQTDPLLTPEFTNSFEAGFNAGLFDDVVTLDAAYFFTSTTDQITSITPSYASGLTSATVNLAETEVEGFEIDLGLNPFRSSSPDQVDWSINLQFSTNATNVVSVTDQSNEVQLTNSSDPGIFAVVGEEFPVIKGSTYERDDNGNVIVNAQTGNPIISSDNKVLGRTTPKYIYGINSQVSWKNFTLSATMDYRTGHVFWSGTKRDLAWSGHLVESAYNRGSFIVPGSVYDDGTGNYVPNTNVTAGNNPGAFSQYYSTYVTGVSEQNVLDASAIKIRELSLKYNVPAKLLENTFISDITISANARNLYTWLPKENRGYSDPEAANTSGNAVGLSVTGNYPPARTFGLGLNVIF